MFFQVNSREAQEDVDLGEVFVQDLEMVTWWFEKKLKQFYWFIPIVFPTDLFEAEALCAVWWCLSSTVFGFVWPVEMTASYVALNMRRARPLRQRFLNVSYIVKLVVGDED